MSVHDGPDHQADDQTDRRSDQIDADAVEKQAYDDVHYHAELEDWEFDVVTHYLGLAPTIDAVPVVRCKDCEHRSYDGNDKPYCLKLEMYLNKELDFFCSYGERKDGEG
jgi:hypothetical protein